MDQKGKKSQSRLRSFSHAFHGIYVVFKTQRNFQIQLFLAFLAVIAGFALSISMVEWATIILTMVLVLSLEAVNTSLELLSNKVESNYSETIGKVKDIAAAAVLISSIGATVIGFLIFLPKIIKLINSA